MRTCSVTIKTLLLVAVIIVYQQMQYIQTTDPGLNKQNMVRIDAEGQLIGHEQQFVAALKTIPGITNEQLYYRISQTPINRQVIRIELHFQSLNVKSDTIFPVILRCRN